MENRRSGFAVIVALAYTLAIMYASLQPFSGWRAPSEEILGFLGAPWPRYVTTVDILLNVIAYLPLGAFLFAALRHALAGWMAVVGATLGAAALSLALESVQMFLPTRIASNLDLLTNVSGAALGALGACVLSFQALAGNPIAAIRNRVIRPGAIGDCGMVVVGLWILVQFHQAPLTLGNGDFREVLGLSPLFAHTPWSYALTEAGVAALSTVAIGAVISLLIQPRYGSLPLVAVALLLAFATKSIATETMARAGTWLQWLTPGLALGTVAGLISLAALLRLQPAVRAISGLLCLAAGMFIVNISPANPYQPVPTFMLVPEPSHLINFSRIVHALSQAWPPIAAAFLSMAWRTNVDATQH